MHCAPTLLLGLVLLAGGCQQQRFTKAGADEEVYGILGKRRPCVPEVRGDLDVDTPPCIAQHERRVVDRVLTLSDALRLATRASRAYIRERETVYLAALDVTGQRNAFRNQYGLAGSLGIPFDGDGFDIEAGAGASVSRQLTTGGSILIDIASNALRNLTGNPLSIAQSILSADIVIPLGRGSGRLVAMEPLRQSERDLLYALREYARFQQTFTVDITTAYYRAHQVRDTLRNEEQTYNSLKQLVDQQAENAAAGRIAPFQVDQARQDLLRAEDRVLRARADFASALDNLKLDLGIPTETVIDLDESDLDLLRETPLGQPAWALEEGVHQALLHRLDLLVARDEEVDACRQVAVARDALGAQFDLLVNGGLATPNDRIFDVNSAEPFGSAGIALDLPLERTAERNAWREAQILALRARRGPRAGAGPGRAGGAGRLPRAHPDLEDLRDPGPGREAGRAPRREHEPAPGAGRGLDPRPPRGRGRARLGEERPDARADRLRAPDAPARARSGRAVGRRGGELDAQRGRPPGDPAPRRGRARTRRARGRRGGGHGRRRDSSSRSPGKQVKMAGMSRRHSPTPSRSTQRGAVWIVLIVLLVIAGAAAFLWLGLGRGEETDDRAWSLTPPLERGPLELKVIETGNLHAMEAYIHTIRNEVDGRRAILDIVPEGTVVTPADIEAGKVLIQLESSDLLDKIKDKTLDLEPAQTAVVDATSELEIQELENASATRTAQLDVRFARIDLERYVGLALAERLEAERMALTDPEADGGAGAIKGVNPGRELLDLIGTLLQDETLDGESLQKIREFDSEISLAREEKRRAEQKLNHSERLQGKGYVSREELEADRLALQRRTIEADKARAARDQFVRYDFPKEVQRLLSSLVEAQDASTRATKRARAAERKSKAKLRSANERLALQQERLAYFKEQYARCTIKATRPGIILYASSGKERHWRSDDRIQKGTQVRRDQQLLQIPDPDHMGAKIKVHESVVKQVREGQRALITVDAVPGKRFEGTVATVSRLPSSADRWLNPDLKVYDTLIELGGDVSGLKPGMSATVEIQTGRRDDVLAVPVQAVVGPFDAPAVYVEAGDGVARRAVKLGASGPTVVEVVSGLEPGDRAVLNPPAEATQPRSKSRRGKRGGGDSSRGGKREKGAKGGGPEKGKSGKAERPAKGEGSGGPSR